MPSKALVLDANILIRAVLQARVAQLKLIGTEVYGEFEVVARERLERRDPDDWPILAAALALGCPIWTEDTNSFGSGVATWTSSSIEMSLRE
jgi:predicted nucleic acid-binding protein